MASLSPQLYFDSGAGITPADGALLFFNVVGSETDKDTYTTSAATTPHANPVVANIKGVFPAIYLVGDYDWVLQDKNNVQINTGSVSELVTGSGQLVNVLARDTLNDAVIDTSLQAGLAINVAENISGNGGGGMWDVVLSSTVTENTYNIVQCTGVATLSLVLRKKNKVNVKQVGAQDGDSIFVVLEALVNAGYTNILVEGNYVSEAKDISLLADKTTITFDGLITHEGDVSSIFSNPTTVAVTATALPAYLGLSVTVTDASAVERGDQIFFISTTVAETQYSTARQWATTVSHVVGNIVYFEGVCKFDFTTAASPQVFHSKRRTLALNSVSMNTEAIVSSGFGWRFDDLKVELNDINQVNSLAAYAMGAVRCYDCVINNLDATNGAYALLLTLCFNTRAKNLTGHNTRHVISPTGFTDGVWVDGVSGSGGLVESHPAFNIHYNNCDIVTGGADSPDYVNLRSIGGSIRNSKFRHLGPVELNGPYVQNVPMVDDTPYSDATFEMENVEWYKDIDASLSIEYGGRVSLKNVNAGGDIIFSAISSGSIGSVHIDNVTSQTNVIVGRGVTLTNTSEVYTPEVISTDVYAIRAYNSGQGTKDAKLHGTFYNNSVLGQTYTFNFRIYQNLNFITTNAYTYGTIKFNAGGRHSNAGQFSYIEREYEFAVIAGGSVNFPTTPIFSSARGGQANDALDITSIVGSYVTDASYENQYINVAVTLDMTALSSPIIQSISYECELHQI